MYLMYDQYLAIHHLFLNGLHTRSDQDDAGGGGGQLARALFKNKFNTQSKICP